MSDIAIPQYYNLGDVGYLFDRIGNTYTSLHVSKFQLRNRLDLGDATKLAMELPDGAFIAGGFVKSAFEKEPANDFDVFFSDEKSLKNLVRRLQGAPKEAFLHGYKPTSSMREFANGHDKFITFTHGSKPAIQLHRVRWFAAPTEAIDKFDFSICRFALDRNLNIHHWQYGVDDINRKIIRLILPVFPTSVGLRIMKLEGEGYKWSSDYYDSGHRDDYKNKAKKWLAAMAKKAEKEGKQAPTVNTPNFGSFEY